MSKKVKISINGIFIELYDFNEKELSKLKQYSNLVDWVTLLPVEVENKITKEKCKHHMIFVSYIKREDEVNSKRLLTILHRVNLLNDITFFKDDNAYDFKPSYTENELLEIESKSNIDADVLRNYLMYDGSLDKLNYLDYDLRSNFRHMKILFKAGKLNEDDMCRYISLICGDVDAKKHGLKKLWGIDNAER